MRSVVDRNVVMRRMTINLHGVEMENFAFITARRHTPQGSYSASCRKVKNSNNTSYSCGLKIIVGSWSGGGANKSM
jgi:hypothetical protein